jgi:hypothetical protein
MYISDGGCVDFPAFSDVILTGDDAGDGSDGGDGDAARDARGNDGGDASPGITPDADDGGSEPTGESGDAPFVPPPVDADAGPADASEGGEQ